MPRIYLLLFAFLLFTKTQAQTVSGVVHGDEGPLSFVSVRLVGGTTGAITNAEGKYELKLYHGTHTLLFQSLGYKSEERTITLTTDQKLDVTLAPQAVQLKEAVVGNTEDPARSIMRRAIAKAPIERMKVKSYKALVYMKGGARMVNIPWLLEKKLAKEGLSENTVYFSETISELTYRAPNFYKNKALSVRSNMSKLGGMPSPNNYVNTSFYEKNVGYALSPLAPNAFAYYTFTYEGIFTDHGVEVNKIKVTPKSGGERVFTGYIYIIEGDWCIHSLNLTYRHEGITLTTNQIYTPIQTVWMPATQKYVVAGKVFGFEFEGNYVASLKDYALVVDPNLVKPLEIIDEKLEPAVAKDLRKKERNQKDEELLRLLADSSTKMTRKTLRKAMRAQMRQQRKEELQKHDGETILKEDSTLVDSLAYKRDSTYWEANRMVSLTELEVKSTVRLDSVSKVIEVRERKDSIKNAKLNGEGTGKGMDAFMNGLVWGKVFYLSKQDTAKARAPLGRMHRLRYGGIMNQDANFNSVEGYVLSTKLQYQFYRPYTKGKVFRDFYMGPAVRYEFARKQLLPTLESVYYFPKGSVKAYVGRGVSQLNPNEGISPVLNGFTTLFFERNYMRLFQKDYVRVELENYFADKVQINSYVELADRRTLTNHAGTFINWNDRSYSPNTDANAYNGTTDFANHRAAIFGTHLIYTPTVAYSIYNGRRSYVETQDPYFHLKLNAGVPGIAQSTSNFVNAAFGIEQAKTLGIRGKLIYYVEAGAFLHKKEANFPDYFHFDGNRTILIVGDGLRSFRNLPYYKFSNAVRFAQQHVVYIPRRFLLSRFPLLEAIGWKESFGYHGLTVPGQPQYSEVTYGIDGIFRFMRVEGFATFNDATFQQAGARVGITLKAFTPQLKRKSNRNSNGGEGSVKIEL